MFRIKSIYTPKLSEAVGIIIAILLIMGFSIIKLEAAPHIPILISIMMLFLFGLGKKVAYKELEMGMAEGAKAGLPAIYLFFFIGILISSWMISGTIPTLIYSGFSIVTPKFFYALAFIVTSIVGVCIGSSLTTIATIGIAFLGISNALGLSEAITAGAIVSGAFFGDKMSPLSDTTNLASSIIKVDLFEHIRNMMWTTGPAFILSLLFFGVLSPDISEADLSKINHYQEGLLKTDLVHWYSIIPIVILLIMTVAKKPALLTLALSSVSAIVLSFIHHSAGGKELFNILFNGYVSHTGIDAVDSLLSRGGIDSMMFTISLVILALSMGGLLFTLGIIPVLLNRVEHLFTHSSRTIASAALTAIGINILVGEQYLSILLTGETFQSSFQKVGLARKNLSRVLEDAGTVINPLVPWSVCGVFISNVLGISTLSYLPFSIFCLLSPVLTILFGLTGKTLTFEDEEHKAVA
ncbi:Na+/H+ antiporter NhaC [Falsibacillus albus]|uniref:Na+/H+ antiporter NhaC n=1 Tax=Falsibacillus albus TaxID=2478915 RepID=A0A3L7K5I3_9BACI|nr:Na+/H+ antiporter NhaC [Falsibacillus albus]RLQ97524.1 Na+/H+ antiporter NhaC [Falsibacillus albus]